MKLRIGTRGSDLALWQARYVGGRLDEAGFEVELVVLKTRGDRIDDVPLQQIEGKAFFTAEIEAALLEGRVDLAVHSHKDLPVESPPGLAIVAVPERADPGERLLIRPGAHAPSAPFLPLAMDSTVGTSAPRRSEQLAALRPDLRVEPLRGNVPTRVRKLRAGRYDAIVLAAAGLDRLALDLDGLVPVPLATGLFVPAPAQGALAIQARTPDEPWLARVRAALHDETTAASIHAERQLLVQAGGGCNLPLGCCVEREGNSWRARGFLGAGHPRAGAPARWAEARGATPQAAVELLIPSLLRSTVTHLGPLSGLRVAIAGTATRGTRVGARLETLGARVLHERVLAHKDVEAPALDAALRRLRSGDALVVTSQEAARRLGPVRPAAGVLVAAVGPATSAVLEGNGLTVDLRGSAGARELAASLPLAAGARVLFPCAAEALDDLEEVLTRRAVQVERLVLYRTSARPDAALARDVGVRVYMSPSAVAAVQALEQDATHGPGAGAAAAGVPVVRVPLGGATARALASRDLSFVAPEGTGAEAIVHLLCRLFSPQGARP